MKWILLILCLNLIGVCVYLYDELKRERRLNKRTVGRLMQSLYKANEASKLNATKASRYSIAAQTWQARAEEAERRNKLLRQINSQLGGDEK